MSPSQWIKRTNAIGIISKSGSYAPKSLRNGVENRDVVDILEHSKIEVLKIIIYL